MGAYEYQPTPIKILSPIGSEVFSGGTLIHVHWQSDLNTAGSAVRLELRNNQGWVADLGYDWSPSGDHECEVYLPLLPNGADYRIRATSTWDPALWGESSGPFTIIGKPLRVNHPNGGEVWRAGQKEWVWWQSNVLFSGTAVRVELWRGGFKVHDLGLAWDPDGEGVREVVVPAVCPGVDYKVRIISTYNPTWLDESDGLLAIKNDTFRSAVSQQDWLLYQ